MTNDKNLFARQHYYKIAACIGRLDISDEAKTKVTEAFGDMFEKDYPEVEGDGGYHFNRALFYQKVAEHNQTRSITEKI